NLNNKFQEIGSGNAIKVSFQSNFSDFANSRATRLIKRINERLKGLQYVPFFFESKYRDNYISIFEIRDILVYFIYYNKSQISDFAIYIDDAKERIKAVLLKK